MKRTFIIYVLIIVMIGVLLGGCTSNSTGNTTGHDQQIDLVVGTTNKVSDTNINDYYYMIFLRQFCDNGLVNIGSNGDIVPELASSWESNDMKTWTFHMIHNATWQDGIPVTSQDVKFTMDYRKKTYANFKTIFSGLVSVEAPDNYTVVMTLSQPDYNFLTSLAIFGIIPEHVYNNVDDPAKFDGPAASIGSGPFELVSFDKDSGVLTFKANDNYWGQKSNISTVEIRYFSNMDTMMMALQKGEIDVPYVFSKGINYYYVPKLLNNGDIGVMSKDSGGITSVLWFNKNKTPYDNKTFRQAISYAINYGEMNNLFTAGYGSTPDAGWVPESSLYYKPTAGLAYDINESKALLDSAGIKDSDGDGIRELPDGSEFEPVLSTRSDNPDNVRAAEMLQKYLNVVGIDLQVKVVDSTTLGTSMDIDKTFEMALTGTTYWGMQMHGGYGSGYIDERMFGWSMVNDTKFQSIVDSLKATGDKDKRKELAGEIQDYYADEMPAIAVYSIDNIQPYSKKYTGWAYSPYNGILCYDTLFNLKKV